MKRFTPTLLLLCCLALPAVAADKNLRTVAGFLVVSAPGGPVTVQTMEGFPLGKWDNNDQLFWKDAKPGDQIELFVPVKRSGRQHLAVTLTKAPDYGIVQFSLDGRKVGGRIDLWSPWVGLTPPVPLGVHDLQEGEHVLMVEIVGKNKESQGTRFGIDRITLRAAAPPVEVDPASPGEVDLWARLHDLGRLTELRQDESCRMFSSYDRTGGNNDGFGGTYSKLWIEDGNSVLAVMRDAGAIERIWFTHSTGRPGLLNYKKEHLKIYVDGRDEPALDVPLEDIFSGALARFPRPLVGEGQGGFYCYVPIAYRDGCKILVEGTGVRFFQITYRTFWTTPDVRSFTMDMSPQRKEALDAAVRLWSKPGEIDALGLANVEETVVDLNLEERESRRADLPKGSRMVRAILLEGTPEELKAAAKARIQIRWDGAKEPAVDLPAEFLFCQAQDAPPYRALLTGTNDAGWYNFLPMPYRQSAQVTVSTDKPIKAKLRILTGVTGGAIETWGYLHTAYNESVPTKPDVYHPFLDRKGTGHYVGTYLVTEGQTKEKLPLWLEGDERFTVDGRLAIHGTGSEDYFNCGWYALPGRLNGPGAQPLHGFPVYRLVGERNQASAFRWHLTDPVPYDSTIRAEIEHGADNRVPADYRSAAFYYEPAP
ncbi:MAG: DUF2961 domain-containing protein [Pirellulales bacterium]|nr:DUF2961 domain-containing protein [Pirellulales bacterium]